MQFELAANQMVSNPEGIEFSSRGRALRDAHGPRKGHGVLTLKGSHLHAASDPSGSCPVCFSNRGRRWRARPPATKSKPFRFPKSPNCISVARAPCQRRCWAVFLPDGILSVMEQATRLVTALSLILMLCATASAYTVVMRGGRRIEIPAQFSVTKTTLTYEAAPGIQITLQMAAIDITATERANNETPGSLLK